MQAIGEDRALPESGSQSPGQWRLRLFAVVASLCLHILLITVALRYGELSLSPESRPSITIGLVPDNPLVFEAVPAESVDTNTPETTQAEEADGAEISEPEQDQLVELEQSVETEATIEAVETAEVEPEPVEVESTAAVIQAPSITSILNTVNQNREQQEAESREWANTCTELQRVAGVLGCQQEQRPYYQALEQAPEAQSVYEFHNPPAETSRSQRALPTIARNSALLAENLAMANVPQGLADQLMAEVEAGISLYSNRGNPTLDVMDRMVDQSAAAQIARELNSPWVQFQRQQLNLRRYSNRQDSQSAQSCGSIGMLILKPSELAGCVSRGNVPGLTVPLQIGIEF